MKIKEHLKNIALGSVVCLLLVWLMDREYPVNYTLTEIATEVGGEIEPPPSPGGFVVAHLGFTRDRVCPTLSERRFQDSARADHDLPNEMWTPIEVSSYTDVFKYIPLPKQVHAGRGKLVLDVTWRCNPLHYLWPIRKTLVIPVDVVKP